jgi:amino acid adenylation domain-containing protein
MAIVEKGIEGFRLSPQQRRLWLLEQEGCAGFAQGVVLIEGPLREEALRRSLERAAARHEIFRTTFLGQDGLKVPFQVVEEEASVAWESVDLTGAADSGAEPYLDRQRRRRFELDSLPVLHALLVRLAPERHLLALALPALAADGRTLVNLLEELAGADAGDEPLQYADFAEWQHELREMGGAEDAAVKAAALRQEALAFPSLRLPFERRSATAPGAGNRTFVPESCTWETGLLPRVEALAAEQGAGAPAFLLTAWQALLARFSGQWEHCPACLFDGRNYADLEAGCGPYARWIPVPARLLPAAGFDEALRQMQKLLSEISDWQHYFAWEEEDEQGEKLPRVLFEHAALPAGREAAGSRLSLVAQTVCTERFLLKLSCHTVDDALTLRLDYDPERLRRGDVERLGQALLRLLHDAVEDPRRSLEELEILTASERTAVLTGARGAGAAGPGLPVHRLFEEQVAQGAARPALVFAERELSYGELDAEANRLAHHLRRLGVGPDVLVALCLDRSAEAVVALLAVLKAGGAYVPLEPEQPKKRLAAMLEDLGWPLVVTRERLAAALPQAARRTVCLDRDAAALAAESAESPAPLAGPGNLAYVIFTSGSTGRPKGVAVEHRQLAGYVQGAVDRLDLPPGARFATVSTFAADLGHTMIFPALCTGGCLHVVPHELLTDAGALADAFERHAIDCLKIVPSHLQALMTSARAEALLPRQRLVLGGEACRWELVDRVRELVPGCRVFNHYGPTETTVGVLAGELEGGEAERPVKPPLGRPLAAARVHILDSRLRPVPRWVAGDVYIGGATVSRGYLGRPDLTAERFVPDPYGDEPGARLYRTGDLARSLADGRIEFLGRADDQVKFHGFRIELEEIRAALNRHPLIADSVVTLVADKSGRDLLAGYYVGRDELDPAALRALLAETILEETIPNVFVRLDRLPLTPNGKIDFRALPAPDEVKGRAQREPVAPRTPAEEALSRIWGEVLGIDPPGVYDNFFELGGHSLLATQLVAKVCEVFQVRLPLRALLEDPTVAGLAAAAARCKVEQSGEVAPAAALPVLVSDPAHRHEPFPLTEVQQAYWVGRSGAFELGNVSTHTYLEIDSTDLDVERLNAAFQRVIDRHDMLRAVVLPDGSQRILEEVPPYRFELFDLRGLDAAEVEERLEAVRERMSHQVLPADRWPLFEICASLLDGRTRLHISRDALIFDAWSAFVVFNELFRFYVDPAAQIPPVEISYRDYVLAEVALQEGDEYRRAWAYWQERVATLPPAPELPLAGNPATLARPRFVRRSGGLDLEGWRRLKERATRSGLTPSGLILAAYAEVLALWSRSPRFTINLTLFHRLPLHPQVYDVVGDFTSLTLLEVDNSQPDPFVLRARRLQEQLWEDLDHRYAGGVRVLREVARRRGRSGGAIFPVVLTSTLALDVSARDVSLRTLSAEIVYGLAVTSQVWLDHSVSEQEDGSLIYHWNAVEDLFPEGLLDDMFTAYGNLLARLAGEAEEGVWIETGRPWLPAAQLTRRAEINATDAPVSGALLHTLFQARAAEMPDQTAVIAADGVLSYAELLRRSNRVAHRLCALGARPNHLVAVVMEKGWEQVAAVLGILGSGAAYLPIDPTLPAERRFYLLSQGEADVVLTQSRLDESLEWPEGVRRIRVDGSDLDGEPDTVLEPLQEPGDLAYVLFTSGSTGQPKGVMIDHRGAVNTVLDINRRFAVGPQDRVLALSALGFDLSVYDIFGLLAAGGTLVMPESRAARDPERWAELVERHGVTVWSSVPALMEMLAVHAADHPETRAGSLRLVMLSGDWIPLSLPDRIRALAGGARLISLGGATEASIWSILYPVESIDPAWPSVPYGRPMDNQTFHVLNGLLEPCPVWVPGHLYIGGTGLAQGYWRDEEKTRASFIEHPRTGERLYRTGDLGRYLPDGNIEFLGREDQQVKIQGHRIELGEIEAALEQHPAIRSVVVTAPGERDSRRLVAYVVADEPAPAEPRPEAPPEPPAPAGRIEGVLERLEFKLREPGLRRMGRRPGFDLARPALGEAELEALYLARRSTRRFLTEPVDAAGLGRLLGALLQVHPAGSSLPKYRYGSASGLYPVQVYLYVKPGRVQGVPGGTYYYHPREHRLVQLARDGVVDRSAYAPVNRPVFDQSAFALFLIGQMRAIEPMYGDAARHYATIEAGLITQLLEMVAPQERLGLCQIGGLDFASIRHLFEVDGDHVLLHSLLGGLADPAALPGAGADEDQELLESLKEKVSREDFVEEAPPAPASGPEANRAGFVEEIKRFLRSKLPEYMVPPTFVFLAEMPLTANGKVDRGALPAPDQAEAAAPVERVAPGSELERAIAAVWQEVLRVEMVGVHDNFFDLGGNSVGMIQVRGRLRRVLDREVQITDLFRHPTIGALAEFLAGRPEEAESAALDEVRGQAVRQKEAMERQRRRMQERSDFNG